MPFFKETQASTGKRVGWRIINRVIRTCDVGPGSKSLRIQIQRGHTPVSYPLSLHTLSPWQRQKAADQLSPGSAPHPAIIPSCCPSAQSLCLWPQHWPMENKLMKGPRSFGSTLNYMWCFMRWAGVRDNGMQILWHGHSKLSWKSHSLMPRAPPLWPNVKSLHFSMVSPQFSYSEKQYEVYIHPSAIKGKIKVKKLNCIFCQRKGEIITESETASYIPS